MGTKQAVTKPDGLNGFSEALIGQERPFVIRPFLFPTTLPPFIPLNVL